VTNASKCHRLGAKVRALRCPSTGSWNGFLLSVRAQVKGFRKMEGGFVERQMVHCGPEIEHVALGAAIGLKALKHILAQVGGEGAMRVIQLAMNWAGAAALLATPTQVAEQSQVFEDLAHGHLLTQEGVIDLGATARGGGGGVDSRRCRRYAGIKSAIES
jgi:hypothetical protein